MRINGMKQIYFVAVFEQGDAGELFRPEEPQRFDTEEQARKAAGDLASNHAGVIAWSQEAKQGEEEYGPAIVFYTAGEVIDMK
jgi:hypothetical protein